MQGIRTAEPGDLDGIQALLRPLEKKGILKPRSHQQLLDDLPHYIVIEREVSFKPLAVAHLGLLTPLSFTDIGP